MLAFSFTYLTYYSVPKPLLTNIPQLWERLDNEERKNLLPKYLTTWEKDSPERTEVIRALLKTLSTTERNFVHGAVKPRGPYRCVISVPMSSFEVF